MKKKTSIIIYISSILIISLLLLGFTYGYYGSKLNGNTNNKSIDVVSTDIQLTFHGNPNIIGHSATDEQLKIMPGKFNETNTFSVTNDRNSKIESYGLVLDDVTNDLIHYETMKLVITCRTSTNEECNGYDGYIPKTNDVLLSNDIEANDTHTYTSTVTYINADVDQTPDVGKVIRGKFNIVNLNDTIDIEGNVVDYNEGDYLQINSKPKKSNISKIYDDEGNVTEYKYKLVGVKPDNHTIGIYNNGSAISTQSLIINKGEVAKVEDNTISITKDSRTVTISVTDENNFVIDNEIKDINLK